MHLTISMLYFAICASLPIVGKIVVKKGFIVQTAVVNGYFIVSCHVLCGPMCVDVTYLTEMCSESRVECWLFIHHRAVSTQTVLVDYKSFLIEIFIPNQK